MTVQNIFDTLNALAPVESALEFDNPGFLVGERSKTVTKALVALDITEAVVEEAAACGAELIVSHHPVIFEPLRSVTDDTVGGRVILSLIRNGISAICMHTNLDAAQGGVNDCLASALGLCDVVTPEEDPLMRVGQTDCTMTEFLERICTSLNLSAVHHCGDGRVRRVGLCGGAAGEEWRLAKKLGCDTYLTGEVKHHQWLEAKAEGMNLVEGGHFATENPVCRALVEQLRAAYPALEVKEAEQNRDPAGYFVL